MNDIKQNLNGRIQQASTFRHSLHLEHNYQYNLQEHPEEHIFTVPRALIFSIRKKNSFYLILLKINCFYSDVLKLSQYQLDISIITNILCFRWLHIEMLLKPLENSGLLRIFTSFFSNIYLVQNY